MTDVDLKSEERPLEQTVRRAIESFECPLEPFLVELLVATGATQIKWLERDADASPATYNVMACVGGQSSSAESPRAESPRIGSSGAGSLGAGSSGAGRIDRSLLAGLEPGDVVHFHAARLSGSGPCRAAGLERLALACDAGGRGALWLENPPRELLVELGRDSEGPSGASLRAAAGLCAARTEFAAAKTREERDAHLVRRGVGALALAHDLRHQLSLALLLTRRLRESEDPISRDRAADDLDAALSKARGVCEDAMSGTEEEEASVLRALRLKDVLAEEARTAASLAGRDGAVGLALRCPKSLLVAAAPSPLSRVLRNLLLNALHATPNGGAVRAWAELTAGGGAVCHIQDNGKGMEERAVRELFTRARTGGGGAGCGTLSTLACVERLGATLEVESVPGEGTTISLHLPGVPPSVDGKHLVVAGDPRVGARLAAPLRAKGERTAWVATCARALLALQEERPLAVWVARGTLDPDLARLFERCDEEGIHREAMGAPGLVEA